MLWLFTMEAQGNPWIRTIPHMNKALIFPAIHHEDMNNWECGTWEPHHPEGPHQRPRWFATQSWDCQRSTYRSHKSPGVRASQIIPSISFLSTTGTSWWCTTAIHGDLMFCTKKTTFANTLIQDIPTFNGSNSMQLADWLVDIETAAHLTNESRTKLAQAKSKGLTCTLITEALTSGKCWEEIKDLLHLKICNSDIHTSVSHFMDIQTKGQGISSSLHT